MIRNKDFLTFFIVTSNGIVYYGDDMGHCNQELHITSQLHSLHLNPDNSFMLILTKDLVLSRYLISSDGKFTPQISVKLSGGLNSDDTCLYSQWLQKDMLAFSVNGSPVRIWDSADEEMEILDREGKQIIRI